MLLEATAIKLLATGRIQPALSWIDNSDHPPMPPAQAIAGMQQYGTGRESLVTSTRLLLKVSSSEAPSHQQEICWLHLEGSSESCSLKKPCK